jgi:hypothetical protein
MPGTVSHRDRPAAALSFSRGNSTVELPAATHAGLYASEGTGATWALLRVLGDEFLPKDRGSEIRCSLRDPDGHLIELG